MKKFSITSAIKQSLKQVFCNLKPAFFLCAIPIILISITSALATMHWTAAIASLFLQLTFVASIPIMWMRAAYGTDPMPKTFFIFRLGKREWKYLGVGLLWVVAAVLSIACCLFLNKTFEDAFFAPLLAAFIGIFLMIFCLRLSFVWVHISLGKPLSFKGSWKESKKIWGRLAIATIVFSIMTVFTLALPVIGIQLFLYRVSEPSVMFLGVSFILLKTVMYLNSLLMCSIVVLFYKESIAGTKG